MSFEKMMKAAPHPRKRLVRRRFRWMSPPDRRKFESRRNGAVIHLLHDEAAQGMMVNIRLGEGG